MSGQSHDMRGLMSNARLMMAFALLQKGSMFIINILTWSSLQPAQIGRINTVFDFIYSTSLFFSREGIRLASLRYASSVSSTETNDEIIRLSSLSLPISLLIGLFLILMSIIRNSCTLEDIVLFILYSLSATVECSVEPIFNVFQKQLYFQPRLLAETSASISKSIVLFLLLRISGGNTMAFGVAQLTSSIVYFISLRAYASKSPSMLGVFVPKDRKLLSSAVVLTIVSVGKFLLTEGDRIILTLFFTANQQGIYAFVSNYGSIVARLIFFPVEESIRSSFAVMKSDKNSKIDDVRRNLEKTLVAVGLLSACILSFGPSAARVALPDILPVQWRSDTVVDSFRWYCMYLALMGIGGAVEACIHAVSSEEDLWKGSIGMFLSSASFFSFVALSTSSTNPVVIIQANMLSCTIRLLWNYGLLVNSSYTSVRFVIDFVDISVWVLFLHLGLSKWSEACVDERDIFSRWSRFFVGALLGAAAFGAMIVLNVPDLYEDLKQRYHLLVRSKRLKTS